MTTGIRHLPVVHGHASARARDARRYLPSVLLAGYGVFILSLVARGIITWYINPTYVIPTTAAALLLLAFAAVSAIRPSNKSAAACGDEGCACGPSTRLWVYVLLAVPLLLGFLVPAHSLAAYSARERGPQIAGLNAAHTSGTVHRMSLAVDTSTYNLQDWVGALSSDPNPADYLHKPVILTGMVLHAPGSVPPGYIMVLRYQVTCCIADAKPEGLIVKDNSHGALRDNEWVTVRGAMGAVQYQGQSIAVVEPRSVEQTKAGDPYMY